MIFCKWKLCCAWEVVGFLNWSPKNIPDRQKCLSVFEKCQKIAKSLHPNRHEAQRGAEGGRVPLPCRRYQAGQLTTEETAERGGMVLLLKG